MFPFIAAAVVVLLAFLWWSREKFTTINGRRTVTLHYTNWCGACKLMKPVWAQVKYAAEGSGITFVEIDEDVAHTPGITGYPTILMVTEGGRTIKYDGRSNFAQLRNWVLQVAPK